MRRPETVTLVSAVVVMLSISVLGNPDGAAAPRLPFLSL